MNSQKPTNTTGKASSKASSRASEATPVDGAQLLDRIHEAILRYVVAPCPEAVVAVALWIAATHAQDAWHHAPRLVIRAPERRCGKSRLLDVVEGASHNPLMTVNATPAAIYRSIGSEDIPTLLIDEADTIFGPKAGDNEDLRGLLNAGHQRGRPALRYDPNTRTVERIETFCMAALAGIGAMPDTIEDRAVVVKMRRRARTEKVSPWRIKRDRPKMIALGRELAGWITPHVRTLEAAEPDMPLEDRAADTWEPLIAVADLAGGDWPQRARHAALVLTGEAERNAVGSDRIRLLGDCRTAFGRDDALPTGQLIARLCADPEAPWATYDQTGLTPMKLAAMLREYEISSCNIRFPKPVGQTKGYRTSDFADAWQRYCPADNGLVLVSQGDPSQPSQPSPPSSTPGRPESRDDLSRPTWTSRHVGGTTSIRPAQDPVPGLSSHGTGGTAGTATPGNPGHPHLRLIDGAA